MERQDNVTLNLVMPAAGASDGIFESEAVEHGHRSARLGDDRQHVSFMSERNDIWDCLLRALDLSIVVITALLMGMCELTIRPPSAVEEPFAISLIVLLASSFFYGFRLYRPRESGALFSELSVIFWIWLSMFNSLIILEVIVQPQFLAFERVESLAFWSVLGCLLQASSRVLLHVLGGRAILGSWGQRRVVVVGPNAMTAKTVDRLKRLARGATCFVGYFDDRSSPRIQIGSELPRLGGIQDIAAFVERERIDQVWLNYPWHAKYRIDQALDAMCHLTVDVCCVAEAPAIKMISPSFSSIRGVPVLNVSLSPMAGLNLIFKAGIDRLIALLVLLFASPLMLIIAIGVKLSSRGPVFYSQKRVSWNKQRFSMLKFRSMKLDAETQSGPVWAWPEDERVTRFGAFLRRTSLDELPQFLNVLKGDMSIVGPRPERPCFVELFKDQVPDYMKKHMVKAGITGWAQINGWRGDSDLVKRIDYDLYYIRNWSVWFDVKIMAMTLVHGFVNKNAY